MSVEEEYYINLHVGAVACLQFGGGDGNKGDEVVGSKSDEGEGGEVERDEGGEEGVGVAVSECGESDGGGEEGVRDESDSDSKDENAYLIKVMYLPDGDDEDELQEARQNVKKVEGETSEKGLNDSVGKEEDGNETEYFNSDNHGSILVTKDYDNTDVCRRRSRFPTYNPNSASPHFYIGMLFKDGEQFKSTIQVIAEHFEATIGDHPKMKLREIQRRVSSEMHVNVNMTRCRRAKKTVNDKLDLEIAINDILPRVEHRNYASHVLSNWFGRKKAKTFEFAFWKVMKSTTEREWEQNKEDLYKLDEDPDDYLHRYYHKDTYLKAYEYDLQPINTSHEWTKSGIEPVLPPIEKTMPSKPKKNRRKAKNEPKKVKSGQLSRGGLIMRCRKCGGEGHNKRSCIQPNTMGTQSCTSTKTRSPKNNNITPSIQSNTTRSQPGMSTQTRSQKKNNMTLCILPNTIGSQSGISMRTRSQKRMAYQEPISLQESTAAKKMKK
ncbi:hypothetical protein GOBAR_DD00057 [Gossypium barbadense]|nr:hypothetical protein GOBAR_DD00057 [Gossypium barbadense]